MKGQCLELINLSTRITHKPPLLSLTKEPITMAKAKAFAELTEKGKKQRLAKYEKERAERGTSEALVRLVLDPRIEDTKDKSNKDRIVFFRFMEFDKATNQKKWYNASQYVREGKDALADYLLSLKKGDLVAIEFKMSEDGKYRNLWNVMDRRQQDAARKESIRAQKEAEKATAGAPVPAPADQELDMN